MAGDPEMSRVTQCIALFGISLLTVVGHAQEYSGGVYDRRLDDGHFVQDFERDHYFQFFDIYDSIPAYIKITHVNQTNSHHVYTVAGANLAYVKTNKYFYYGVQLPQAGSALVQITEKLLLRQGSTNRYHWPNIIVSDPLYLFVNRLEDPVAPLEKSSPGIFIGVNDNDDDQDGIADNEDPQVVGEQNLVAIELGHPGDVPIKLSWDNSLIHLYETPNKAYGPGATARVSRIGANITNAPYKGRDDHVVYVEGVAPGATALVITGPGGLRDQLRINVVGADMAMDGNRDDILSFTNPEDDQFSFWVNNDYDTLWKNSDDDGDPWQEDDLQMGKYGRTAPDCMDNEINCVRDIEDFARLHIHVDPNTANQTGIVYSFQFENLKEGSPSINIFPAVDDSSDYLRVLDVAQDQIKQPNITISGVTLEKSIIDSNYIKSGGQISPFLIEGRNSGIGDLAFYIAKNGCVLYKKSVHLSLHNIDWFYDVHTVGATSGVAPEVYVDSNASESQKCRFQNQSSEYLLFVHGWNMPEWEKYRWTETIYKRLWWQGYKGQVGMFSWPTLFGFHGSLYQILFETHHFDNSELLSWLSSDALESVFKKLNTANNLRVLAHSMGNVVAGEAIKKYSGKLHTYIASQAAISANTYDGSVTTMVNRVIDVPWWPLDPKAPISTPNIYGHYPTGLHEAESYLISNQYSVLNMRNYYNANDWALVRWELNNVLKPDGGTPYLYKYEGRDNVYEEGVDQFLRGNIEMPSSILHIMNERERYQIFAYCAESRVKALGQVSLGGGYSTMNLAVNNLLYNDEHYSHSREFRSNIAAEWDYWKAIMRDCDFISTMKQE